MRRQDFGNKKPARQWLSGGFLEIKPAIRPAPNQKW